MGVRAKAILMFCSHSKKTDRQFALLTMYAFVVWAVIFIYQLHILQLRINFSWGCERGWDVMGCGSPIWCDCDLTRRRSKLALVRDETLIRKYSSSCAMVDLGQHCTCVYILRTRICERILMVIWLYIPSLNLDCRKFSTTKLLWNHHCHTMAPLLAPYHSGMRLGSGRACSVTMQWEMMLMKTRLQHIHAADVCW
jgi:hypothetical protein